MNGTVLEGSGLDGGDLFIGSGSKRVKIPPRAGRVLIVPHGTEIATQPVYRGIRYMVKTQLYFKPHAVPHSFTFCSDPQFIKTLVAYRYREGQESTTKKDENEMKKRIEETHRVHPIGFGNGLEKDEFCDDVWKNILNQILFSGLLSLMACSKDLGALTRSDSFWKGRFYELWSHQENSKIEDFCTLDILGTWYERFKIQNYAFKNYSGTVVDIGTYNTKLMYFGFQTQNRGQLFSSSFRSFYQVVGDLWTKGLYPTLNKSAICFGEMPMAIAKPPSLKHPQPKHLNAIFQILSYSSNRVCLILSPGDELPHLPKSDKNFKKSERFSFELRWCEASVAALCAYNKKSGIVVSLGASKAWIEVVKDYHVVYTCAVMLTESTEVTVGWLLSDFKEKSPEALLSPLEFCCIGGKFDQEAITIFEAELQKKLTNTKYQIISKMEHRFTASVSGAFFAPVKNKNVHLYPSNCHLIRPAFHVGLGESGCLTFDWGEKIISQQSQASVRSFLENVGTTPTPLAATGNLTPFALGEGSLISTAEPFTKSIPSRILGIRPKQDAKKDALEKQRDEWGPGMVQPIDDSDEPPKGPVVEFSFGPSQPTQQPPTTTNWGFSVEAPVPIQPPPVTPQPEPIYFLTFDTPPPSPEEPSLSSSEIQSPKGPGVEFSFGPSQPPQQPATTTNWGVSSGPSQPPPSTPMSFTFGGPPPQHPTTTALPPNVSFGTTASMANLAFAFGSSPSTGALQETKDSSDLVWPKFG